MSVNFLDTNVLVYSIAEDDSRAERARNLLSEGGLLSVQVLNEFVAVARRRYKMDWLAIQRALATFAILCPRPVSLTYKTHKTAVQIAEQHGYRIYDSLIIAAALESGCETLYSEDLHDGQVVGTLTIRNPFNT